MNIVKFYFDNNKNLISTSYNDSENSIPQSSNDNYIYLYTDSQFLSVDLNLKDPYGKVLPTIHMVLSKDEEGNSCWIRRLPFAYTDFRMSNATARMSVSFVLNYYTNSSLLAYPRTVESQIIIKRTVNGNTETDGSYNGTDVKNLWLFVGKLAQELSTLDTDFNTSRVYVDNVISETSSNPVQNRVITAYVQPKLVSGSNIKTLNGVSLLGEGNIELGKLNLVSITDIGTPSVRYDTVDGITITSTEKYTYNDRTYDEVSVEKELPIFPGKNINIDATEDGNGIIISAEDLDHVNLTVPSGATQGELSEADLNILKSDYDSYILFSDTENTKEIFRLNTDNGVSGSLCYSHLEYENNKFMLKSINITLNTKAWILHKKEL